MKNQIYTAELDGKFAVFLYRYHEKPSGSITPILSVSSDYSFDSETEAMQHLWKSLKPEVRENTEMPSQLQGKVDA